jgi:hypothetical protein
MKLIYPILVAGLLLISQASFAASMPITPQDAKLGNGAGSSISIDLPEQPYPSDSDSDSASEEDGVSPGIVEIYRC